jgi:hypothetical protein
VSGRPGSGATPEPTTCDRMEVDLNRVAFIGAPRALMSLRTGYAPWTDGRRNWFPWVGWRNRGPRAVRLPSGPDVGLSVFSDPPHLRCGRRSDQAHARRHDHRSAPAYCRSP